ASRVAKPPACSLVAAPAGTSRRCLPASSGRPLSCDHNFWAFPATENAPSWTRQGLAAASAGGRGSLRATCAGAVVGVGLGAGVATTRGAAGRTAGGSSRATTTGVGLGVGVGFGAETAARASAGRVDEGARAKLA